MGREIRRVPPDWEHPKAMRHDYKTRHEIPFYIPLLDLTLTEAQREWDLHYMTWDLGGDRNRFTRWDTSEVFPDGTSITAGELIHPSFEDAEGPRPTELDDDGCYAPYRRRAWTSDEATHYQIYETVSEGSPTSPVLPDLAAVASWLVDQGYTQAQADGFVSSGYAPSLAIVGGRVYSDIEACALEGEE